MGAFDVTVPAGSGPGDAVAFAGSDGTEMHTRVPEGFAPGDSFRVEVLDGTPEVSTDRLRLSAQPALLSLQSGDGGGGSDEPVPSGGWLEELLDALTKEQFVNIVDGFLGMQAPVFLTSRGAFFGARARHALHRSNSLLRATRAQRMTGEHTLAQTDVHAKYKRLYESRIEALMKKHDVEPAAFVGALLAASAAAGAETASAHARRRHSMLASLCAIDDFEAFSAMMRQRAAEQEEDV